MTPLAGAASIEKKNSPRPLTTFAFPSSNLSSRANSDAHSGSPLNQAASANDLHKWLDGETLRRLWPSLWLPSRLRALWQARFPELAQPPQSPAGA